MGTEAGGFDGVKSSVGSSGADDLGVVAIVNAGAGDEVGVTSVGAEAGRADGGVALTGIGLETGAYIYIYIYHIPR